MAKNTSAVLTSSIRPIRARKSTHCTVKNTRNGIFLPFLSETAPSTGMLTAARNIDTPRVRP